MGIIQTMLRQEATYWPTNGIDSYGEEIAGTPEVIKVRWEDVSEEFLDDGGGQQISNAFVYVEKDLDVGGWLFLGRHASLPPEGVQLLETIGYGVNQRSNPDYIPPEQIVAATTAPVRPSQYGKGSIGLRSSREGRQRMRNTPPPIQQNMIVGGALAPGTLEDLIYRISKFEKTPNLKATQTLRVAIL